METTLKEKMDISEKPRLLNYFKAALSLPFLEDIKIPWKTRACNFFRAPFTLPLLETPLAAFTRGRSADHPICKLTPNHYQYPAGTIRTLERDGIKMTVDISDFMCHYLYFGFRDVSIGNLFALCKEGFTVLDIGVNIGWTVQNLAKRCGKGKVYGFEPDPFNFERCSENLRANNFDNITVFPVGLGSENRRVDMEIRTPSNLGGNRVAPPGTDSSRPVQSIEIVRLDDFQPIRNLARLDLIKMDVEGYELMVLRGGEQLLRRFRPILFIELDDNNLKDQGASASALIQFLAGLGYSDIKNGTSGESISNDTDFRNCHWDIIARQ